MKTNYHEKKGIFEKCKKPCKKRADFLKLLFFINSVTEYVVSITKITQLLFCYKGRFNNVFTALLLNESFIKMFSQLNNIICKYDFSAVAVKHLNCIHIVQSPAEMFKCKYFSPRKKKHTLEC